MRNIEQSKHIDSLVKAAKECRLLVFCGAGVSMLAPSKSPSWWEIYETAARALARRFQEGFPELQHELRIDELLKPLQTQQLADIIVDRFAGETFVEILKVVDIADANENHMLIVALTAMGCLRGIVTTNFDTLLERTAAVRDISFRVTTPGIEAKSTRDPKTPLIKLHGSAVDALNLIETSSHKAREVSQKLIDAWKLLIPNSELLVIGYSGADLNFGAAGAFFQDFIRSGGHIYWLYRPGREPIIPQRFCERIELIEDELPDFLRGLAVTVGAESFTTPVTGRNAQLALEHAMEEWSRQPYIGKWSAATFFHSLTNIKEIESSNSSLNILLSKLAQETVTKFSMERQLQITDLAAGAFFNEIGRDLMRRVDIDGATEMFKASISLYESLYRELEDDRSLGSFKEQCLNLSSSWSSYAHTLVILGNREKAKKAFFKALQYDYLGGIKKNFLITLQSILQYNLLEQTDIRLCMRIASAGIRTADRYGAVEPSIELRLLLSSYHIERNEIWIATELLREAKRRATAIYDQKNVLLSKILEGALLLRRGEIQEGLTAIAAVVSVHNVLFINQSVENVRQYLVDIGIPQEGPFKIDLTYEQIPNIVKQIENEIATAKENQTSPWKGRHCRTQKSCIINLEHAKMLFYLGVAEFEGSTTEATIIGLSLAKTLLECGHFYDAVWTVQNVLAKPDTLATQRGQAHTILAHAYASLGYLDLVDSNLHAAKLCFEEANEIMPFETADVGLWHSIQCGDVEKGVYWAEQYVEGLKDRPDREILCADVATKIDSWGMQMTAVSEAFRTAAKISHINLPNDMHTTEEKGYFRRFSGTTADIQATNVKKVYSVLEKARRNLNNNELDRALSLINSLIKRLSKNPGSIPDHQIGMIIAMQIHCLSRKIAPQDLNNYMDLQRKNLVGLLAFSSLARLEVAMALTSSMHGQPSLAADILARHSFIGEFPYDPLARVSLLAWELQIDFLRGRSPVRNERDYYAGLASHYYGTQEANIFSEFSETNLGTTSEHDDLNEIYRTYISTLNSSEEALVVDAALKKAIHAFKIKKALTPSILASLKGDRANWALKTGRFNEAVKLYRKVTSAFRSLNDVEGALNAMAGEARSHSQMGDHSQAVRIFEQALNEAMDLPIRTNLLLGLATTHLLEATRRSILDLSLIDLAIVNYQEVIKSNPIGSKERAYALVGLARAYGEKGEQDAALSEFDQATAEFAHLGSPMAKLLLENRAIFEAGKWRNMIIGTILE